MFFLNKFYDIKGIFFPRETAVLDYFVIISDIRNNTY